MHALTKAQQIVQFHRISTVHVQIFSPGNAEERNYFQCKTYAVISYFLNMKCTATVCSCYTTAVQHSAEYRYSTIMYGYESFKVNLAMGVVEKDWVIVKSPRYCGLSVLRTPNDVRYNDS